MFYSNFFCKRSICHAKLLTRIQVPGKAPCRLDAHSWFRLLCPEPYYVWQEECCRFLCISADPCRQQGERVRGGITSSKGQEVITSSKGKKQENMKEEARSKKQLQATSGKKQETRSQEATSGWKTGQRSHYKQQGQEGRKQERRSKKQEAITGNKRQEARNKKPGSNKRLEDRSEKQETTSQEATSGWEDSSQRSKKQEARKQQAAGRQVRELVFLSIQKATLGRRLEDRSEKQETRSQEETSGWKTGQRASFLVDSESNVRQAAGRQLRELVFL